jgi:L-ascorbate metabolism protein UlaG (beta-lactamase superfamily)
MDIQYLGHSSFRLKGKNATVIIDPFNPEMVGLKFPKNSADIVTISHNHEDHNNSEAVADTKKVITGPGEYEVQGVSIIGIPTYHDEKKGEERGKNTIFVFEIDDLRICHLGDLGHKLTEKILEEIGDIDILMVPVGGFFTLDPTEAIAVIHQIEPSIIIPMHFQTPDLKTELFEKLKPVETFLNESGIASEHLDKLNIKKIDINEEEEKIVILDRK